MERDRLTEAEIAQRVGTTVGGISKLVELGILQPDEGTFARRDVMRARVVEHLEETGIEAEALAAAIRSGDLTLGYMESSGRRHPRSERTFTQLAEELGLSFTALERIYVAFGIPRPSPDEYVREEDLEAIKTLPVLVGAGVEEGDVLRFARIWGDSARRVSQFASHFFHNTIEEPFRRRGLSDNEAFEAAIREVSVRMGRLGEDLLGWLLRRHAETFQLAHQFEHVETALEQAGVRRKQPRNVEAAVFADLTGYTTLTEEAGDEVAAGVSLTLAQLVSEVAAEHNGEVVKMLGDGVHFYYRDPGDAVRASLQVVESVGPRGLPPAHVGVNAGPMIYEEGDYFGRTVNIAARIAGQASAGQVFVGEDLVRAIPPEGFRLLKVGDFNLKGVAKPLTLYEALRDHPG